MNSTFIFYPPFDNIGNTYQMCLDQFKDGYPKHADALRMLAVYLEATAGDLNKLAKVIEKHDISVSGDENSLLVFGPEEVLGVVKLESGGFSKFDPRRPGVIVQEVV